MLVDHGTQAPGLLPFSGKRLRELREQQGWSCQELALRTQPPLSRAYIYLLEGTGEDEGARRPSYDVVLRLAKALEVDPQDFSEQLSPGVKPKRGGAAMQERTKTEVPVALREAAERFSIPEEDVHQLAMFSFRGRRPTTAADWVHLWMGILKSVGLELP